MISAAKTIEIISALSGAGGTFLLYKGTFGLVAFTPYVNDDLIRETAAANRKRQRLQRWGLGLLFVSFLCVLAHVFVE